ncbi:MAG: bifunctional hydroxymethylpyrimidine kinase/phosphomethylpyrimidine kinase [Gemmatimonadota bacterium]|nr:MAG: bifunctional hydroxymethylpyrimidine kinase/phosphomethylpyrimidine kinase [Gemmatimonadota bacterium]
MDRRPVALTIAGSDSGGGAGIQADLKTFQAFGVFGTSAITAITAQNTVGVRAIQKIDPAVVAAQILAVAEDLQPAALKTGMLADAPIIEAVAGSIRETRLDHLVLDPVMVAKSGARLLEEDAIAALQESLLPLAQLVTPNLPEAAILAARPVATLDDMRAAAEELLARGARAVLIKGGHLSGSQLVDLYFDGSDWHDWRDSRLETRHTHGTGCTLSAAICAGLALGRPPLEAIGMARDYTRRAIEAAPGLGEGHGPLNHWVPAIG